MLSAKAFKNAGPKILEPIYDVEVMLYLKKKWVM
jgi:translation elongation factor EF-G